jgi:hypothetical protein
MKSSHEQPGEGVDPRKQIDKTTKPRRPTFVVLSIVDRGRGVCRGHRHNHLHLHFQAMQSLANEVQGQP